MVFPSFSTVSNCFVVVSGFVVSLRFVVVRVGFLVYFGDEVTGTWVVTPSIASVVVISVGTLVVSFSPGFCVVAFVDGFRVGFRVGLLGTLVLLLVLKVGVIGGFCVLVVLSAEYIHTK